MYSTKPLGINIKDNDYDVEDGFLKESLNMQYRDGVLRPIPERLISSINVTGYYDIIFHKVSDEGQINVLAFKSDAPNINLLYWIGTIINGVYSPESPAIKLSPDVTRTAGMSFVILNGMIYFMGDGSSASEQYYIRLQFNDTNSAYEFKDMYAWKSLIPFYPFQSAVNVSCPANSVNVFSQCGMVLIRTTLSLKSGEEVLHSPIYAFILYGINRSDVPIIKGTTIENIHSFINLNFSFLDNVLFEEEISAINIYATTPEYEMSLTQEYSDAVDTPALVLSETLMGHITKKAEEPFYLIKTINAPTTDKILLTVGPMDTDITYSESVSKIDISTIAAGEIMPVDDFTHHKLYGKITAYNGRLTVDSPITVLGPGHLRALALEEESGNAAFRIDTEDGKVDGIAYLIDKAISFVGAVIYPRGVLSYPDRRATEVGGSNVTTGAIATSSINAGGDDYQVDDILTISGGGANATIKATEIIGEIVTVAINTPGTGHAQYDRITISGGGADAELTVIEVDVDGGIVDFLLSETGTGYVVGSNIATTSDGSGIDFTVNITAVKGAITAYSTENKGSGYSTTTGAVTTVSPAGGTGFKLNILSVEQSVVRMVKLKKNALHNIACCFDVSGAGFGTMLAEINGASLDLSTDYNCYFNYTNYTEITNPSIASAKYSSNNRVQFSDIGEFSVWPAKNSYRIGKGKIMAVGANSVNPGANLTLAPLVVGTTDGVYTGNLDPTGNLLFTSFTQNAHIPYLSKETIQIEGQLIFVSDKGLMAYNGGNPISFTDKFFPLQGDGNFPNNNTVLPNYNAITNSYFGGSGNPYMMSDIVAYLKDALLAYDARREVIWCSNPNKTFSLLYDVKNGFWGMSLFVFSSKSEYFSVVNTSYGDIFTRFMIRKTGENYMRILSGEDMNTEVYFHILTRPLKMGSPDMYKKIVRAASRCEIIRKNTNTGYVTFGLWGKNDSNKSKINIPLVAISDGTSASFPDNVRQNVMIGARKGKYKFITILQGGKALPDSSIVRFDIVAELVDDKLLR